MGNSFAQDSICELAASLRFCWAKSRKNSGILAQHSLLDTLHDTIPHSSYCQKSTGLHACSNNVNQEVSSPADPRQRREKPKNGSTTIPFNTVALLNVLVRQTENEERRVRLSFTQLISVFAILKTNPYAMRNVVTCTCVLSTPSWSLRYPLNMLLPESILTSACRPRAHALLR